MEITIDSIAEEGVLTCQEEIILDLWVRDQ